MDILNRQQILAAMRYLAKTRPDKYRLSIYTNPINECIEGTVYKLHEKFIFDRGYDFLIEETVIGMVII
jgi:hypothetical protein